MALNEQDSQMSIDDLVKDYMKFALNEYEDIISESNTDVHVVYDALYESIDTWLKENNIKTIDENVFEDAKKTFDKTFLEHLNAELNEDEEDDSFNEALDEAIEDFIKESKKETDEDDDSDDDEDDDSNDDEDSDDKKNDDLDEAIKEFIKEHTATEENCEDDEECDEDEEDDEDDDDLEDLDEIATKHKITKTQSIIDKRKRATDPKYKLSRRKTERKRAARGGRVVDRKLSKSLKKSFKKGFGKRWESEFDSKFNELDTIMEDGINTEELAGILTEQVDIHKEAIQESISEAVKEIPTFGSLNEEESKTLVENFSKLISENIDQAINSITESLLEKVEQYKEDVITPYYNQHINEYIETELLPAVNENVNDYLDFIINSRIEEIMESGMILKSRDSLQLENFRDKLLGLIEDDLQIMPEQEDAYISLENKCKQLSKTLHEDKVEQISSKRQINILENQLWLEKNMPYTLSEATREKVRTQMKNSFKLSFNEFETAAKQLFKECNRNPELKESTLDSEQSKKKQITDSIVERTLQFMNKRSV